MGIDRFNNEFFKDFFEYNDSGLAKIANNLYEKIKGNGILPRYVEREQEISRINVNAILTVFDDWFLPSLDELQAMYNNLKVSGVGDFNQAAYWSSSEENSASTKNTSFTTGASSNTPKSASLGVRACRSFTATAGAYSLRDVGQAGGLIFYIDGTTFYEAAPTDQSSSVAWSDIIDAAIGTTGTVIGTGQANTTAILAQSATAPAAKLCNDLSITIE